MAARTFLIITLLCGLKTATALGEDKLIIIDSPDPDKGSILLIHKPHSKCQLTRNPEVIAHIMKTIAEEIYKPASTEEMWQILGKCGFDFKKAYDRFAEGKRMEDVERKITIFPGTKWCGDGTEATSDDDLGAAIETDMCCRAHDKCDDIIPSKESRHNLTNDSMFTTLNCECDDTFLNCLYDAESMVANEVGNLYFNVLESKCYEYDYPIICTNTVDLLILTYCKEYGRDTSKPKSYRWRAAKSYDKLSVGEYLFGAEVSIYHMVEDLVTDDD